MKRLHTYSAFLLALLTGSAFLVAALTAGPSPSPGGADRQEKASAGQEESPLLLADHAAAGRQAAIHLRYGKAGWEAAARAANGSFLSGEPLLTSLQFGPKVLFLPPAKGQPVKAPPLSAPEKSEDSLFPLAPGGNINHRHASKFKAYVDRHAARFRIKPNLVFAIIKAESNFNVLAVSTASAQGLMQLVPTSGGRAAYKMVYGEDVVPTREYLQDPDNNIELGTAYLRHLAEEYFKGVENADSRDYCLIAAYNTGPGNVYRAFGGDYAQAMACINSLSPPEVFEYLTRHLPYEETRNYLAKVVSARREFFDL
jgi:soluble lytic murein transglycosylase-like protein